MEGSAVARLLPAGTRLFRLFTAPEVASGAVAVADWRDAGMRLVKERSRGRAAVGCGVFLKEYIYNSRWEKLRRHFLPPRPFVALKAARRLEELDIPTPRVLIAARGIAPGGDICDLLVTEELPRDIVFGDKLPSGSEKLAELLVPVLLRLHDNGFCHTDLNLRNWYETPDGRWGLIDLDAAVPERRMSKFWRTFELARLASSNFLVYRRFSGIDVLTAIADDYLERYTSGGGQVYEEWFMKQVLTRVNRFRTKYLHLEEL